MRSKKLFCPFTKAEINLNTYIKQYKKFNLSQKEFKFKILNHNFGDIVQFDKFKELYINKLYSLPDFYKEFGISYCNILWLIEYYNLQKRNIKAATNTEKNRKKYKETCIQKYGVENVSQAEDIKEKKRQTFLRNYGVDNIRKSKDFCVWLNEYMMEKYNKKRITSSKEQCSLIRKMWWKNLTKEDRDNKICKQLKNLHSGSRSTLEINFQNYLNLLQISYQPSFYINKYQFDYCILNTNILIEVNGDFWHANPAFYCDSDILRHPSTNGVKASDIWKKDQKKLDLAKSKGYHVVTIWENFLKNSSEKEILEKIYNEIKINKKNTEQI